MSHLFAFLSGVAMTLAVLSVARAYVPLAVFMSTAAVLFGLVASRLARKESKS